MEGICTFVAKWDMSRLRAFWYCFDSDLTQVSDKCVVLSPQSSVLSPQSSVLSPPCNLTVILLFVTTTIAISLLFVIVFIAFIILLIDIVPVIGHPTFCLQSHRPQNHRHLGRDPPLGQS